MGRRIKTARKLQRQGSVSADDLSLRLFTNNRRNKRTQSDTDGESSDASTKSEGSRPRSARKKQFLLVGMKEGKKTITLSNKHSKAEENRRKLEEESIRRAKEREEEKRKRAEE